MRIPKIQSLTNKLVCRIVLLKFIYSFKDINEARPSLKVRVLLQFDFQKEALLSVDYAIPNRFSWKHF